MIARAGFRRLGGSIAVALVAAALLAPIAIVVILSFSGDGYLRFPPRSASLQWYVRFLGDPRWRAALASSLAIAAMASLIATAAGFLAAYALARGRMAAKQSLLSLILLPMIVPHIITAIALYFLSAKAGLIGNLPWIALTHAVVALPVVVLIVTSALKTLDPNVERAALSLGASPLAVFRRVVIPLAAPGLVSGSLFAFLTSFDELVISLFLSGVKSQTLPVRIWNSLSQEVEPTIAAVSSVLIAATLLALLVDRLIRTVRERRAPLTRP